MLHSPKSNGCTLRATPGLQWVEAACDVCVGIITAGRQVCAAISCRHALQQWQHCSHGLRGCGADASVAPMPVSARWRECLLHPVRGAMSVTAGLASVGVSHNQGLHAWALAQRPCLQSSSIQAWISLCKQGLSAAQCYIVDSPVFWLCSWLPVHVLLVHVHTLPNLCCCCCISASTLEQLQWQVWHALG